MTHIENINQFIDGINEDKSLPQPEKNYLLSDAKRLRMMLIGTGNMTIEKPPADLAIDDSECTCPAGGLRSSCPVHGKQV